MTTPPRPRVGFLGLGWIGLKRMEAIIATRAVEVAAICDLDPENASRAAQLVPNARQVTSLDELLALGLEGIVIATPSALHAAQSLAALGARTAVFCQKPLGRSAAEVGAVIAAARDADRLLGVDLSYRHTAGMRRVRELVGSGALGRIQLVDLVFHNAYGPDKPWFYDPVQSGGGCLMDLGTHLVDLALWVLDFPRISSIHGRLFANGAPLGRGENRVEDLAACELELEGGAVIRLACSWRLHAGQDAVIEAAFYGTRGGAAFHNLSGSFYDFTAEHYAGTARTVLAEPPDDWGGRAAADWARQLADGQGFDRRVERLLDVAQVIDRIYGR